MILLTIDEIIMLHGKLLETTGGLPGLRDRGILESAVFSMNASFEDVEQYPTVEEKAARVTYALIKNHALVDGNKRVGILAVLRHSTLNGIVLEYTQQDLIDCGLSIATIQEGYQFISS